MTIILLKNTSEIDFNQLDISYFNYYPNEAFLEYTYFIDANSNSLSLTNIITEAVSEDIQEDIKNIPNQVEYSFSRVAGTQGQKALLRLNPFFFNNNRIEKIVPLM